MSKRTAWRTAFLSVTALAIVMELFAAFDGDPDTEPLTELAVTFVPWWVTIPVVVVLAAWLPPHFISAYRKRRNGRS